MKNFRVEMKVEGILPERALLRLQRAGVSIYRARKIEKNAILFRVKKKDIEKVFAIYPKVCYNNSSYALYAVSEMGGVGLMKAVEFCTRRVGVVLGILLFGGLTLAADNLVFGVEFVGSEVYQREVLQALNENGIKKFALYPEGKEPLVTAKILSLHGVEFCSVQKVGYWVRVETHIDPYTPQSLQKKSLQAAREGEVHSITVLRGTPLKQIGERVTEGEDIVGNWFLKEDGEQVKVEPIARVQIACKYAALHEAEDEESAFAQSYLTLNLLENDEIVEKNITWTDGGFFVEISYIVTQTVNF